MGISEKKEIPARLWSDRDSERFWGGDSEDAVAQALSSQGCLTLPWAILSDLPSTESQKILSGKGPAGLIQSNSWPCKEQPKN